MSDKYRFTINYMIGDADGYQSESKIIDGDNVFLKDFDKALSNLKSPYGNVEFNNETIDFNEKKGFISEFEADLLRIIIYEDYNETIKFFKKWGFNEADFEEFNYQLGDFTYMILRGHDYLHFTYESHKCESLLQETQYSIHNLRQFQSVGELSDGTHTFNELYDFRMIYNALLFNEWYLRDVFEYRYQVHKSWKHEDGQYCFGSNKEWFIVSAMLPTGLISNHYPAKYWDLFQIPEYEKALFLYDGHTSQDVFNRLKDLITN